MILLLFGPPGCGKGTQAPLLRDRLGIPAISTGDMLRRETGKQTDKGKFIDRLLADGRLVPDAMVNDLLELRLAEADCHSGFLIDGYPRTVEQASHLMDLLERLGHRAPALIHLDVPERVLVSRMSARWTCSSCGAVYNMLSRPPQDAGRCDSDGEMLSQRNDDTVATSMRRLDAYRELTDPVLSYFSIAGGARVLHVNGHQAPDDVFAEIKHSLDQEVFARVRRRKPD